MITGFARPFIRSSPSLMLAALMLISLTSMSAIYNQHAFAHKPLEQSEDVNNDLRNALIIPDHKISWAIYQNLDEVNIARFFVFEGTANEELYAQLSIPVLNGLEDFSPRLALLGPGISESDIKDKIYARIVSNPDLPFTAVSGMNSISFIYEREPNSPRDTFYEPFTQTSYWTKQEIRVILPNDGQYFLVVYAHDVSELVASSKFTLAVGEIEDFAPLDFITVLPSAWLKTKFFFEDPVPVLGVVLIPFGIAGVLVIRKIRSIQSTSKKSQDKGQD